MKLVATNVRFPKEDYQQLRALAFQENVSLAQLIRSAVQNYKTKKLSRLNEKQRLLNLMLKSRIKINVSAVELAHTDRKFER